MIAGGAHPQSMPADTLTCDVAIVGYGPSAQCLAALLARAGLSVVALERYHHLYNLPRAGHVDHETVRLVQSVGDVDKYVATLWEVREEYAWLTADRRVLMLQPAHDAGDSVSGWFSDYSQWQPHLEDALDTAARAAGATVLMGWQCTGLCQERDEVRLLASRTQLDAAGTPVANGPVRQVLARYVVGADGANSYVRGALGIEQSARASGERWLDVDMETIKPLKFVPNIGQICDPCRPRMLMPLGKTHRRFEWMVLPQETDEEMERPETAWKLLGEYGVTPETHRIARQIVYTFQARMAQQWRAGRVFLIGDAAHTMPPYAGQGLLSALRDASNLAWKLELVIKGKASLELLDTYETERRPHVSEWTDIALAEGRISCELDPARAAERDQRMLAGERLAVPRMPALGAGIFAGGRGTASGIAGSLGLQGRVQTETTTGRCDDLLGARRISLLVHGIQPGDLLSPAIVAALESLGAALVNVLPPGSVPRPNAVVDVDGRYQQYFARHSISAVINRPDYYVFGATREPSELPHLAAELLSRLGAGSSHV